MDAITRNKVWCLSPEAISLIPHRVGIDDLFLMIKHGETVELGTYRIPSPPSASNLLPYPKASQLARMIDARIYANFREVLIAAKDESHGVIGFNPGSWQRFALLCTQICCERCVPAKDNTQGIGQVLQIPIPVFAPSQACLIPIIILTRCALDQTDGHVLALPIMPPVSDAQPIPESGISGKNFLRSVLSIFC